MCRNNATTEGNTCGCDFNMKTSTGNRSGSACGATILKLFFNIAKRKIKCIFIWILKNKNNNNKKTWDILKISRLLPLSRHLYGSYMQNRWTAVSPWMLIARKSFRLSCITECVCFLFSSWKWWQADHNADRVWGFSVFTPRDRVMTTKHLLGAAV